MKDDEPSFYKIIFDKATPFRCTYIDQPTFDHPWHFHPAIELTLILESEGIRYIGDNTSNFYKGDLILIGSNLPHIWINEKNKISRSKRITLQFPKNFMNGLFNSAEELEPLANLFKLAERGIYFPNRISSKVENLLLTIHESKGLPRWIKVFELLKLLIEVEDYKILASPNYQANFSDKDINRMNRIFNISTTILKIKLP